MANVTIHPKNWKTKPPTWVTVVSSILLLLMSSKEQLIDSLPITNADTIMLYGSWYMWVLKAAGILMSILALILGVSPTQPENPLKGTK